MGKGITLIDIAQFLPDEDALDTLLSRFFEYTEKDLSSTNLRDDVMALAVGYQTVKLFGFLANLFSKEPFDELTGKELSDTIRYSMDYFNQRLTKEGNDL
jgi:hypothetical protein